MQHRNQSAFSFIIMVTRPFTLHIAGIVFVGVVWALSLNIQPYIVRQIINDVMVVEQNKLFNTIGFLIILYMISEIFFVLTFRFYDWVSLLLKPNLKKHIGLVLMDRMMNHSLSFYQQQFSGSLANKIIDIVTGIPDIVKLIANRLVAYSLLFLFSLYSLSTVHLKFTAALSVWLFLYILISFVLVFRFKHLAYDVAEARSRVTGYIVDILTNMASVRLFSGKKYEETRLNKSMNMSVEKDQKRDWFFLKMYAVQESSFVLFQALCFWWLLNGLVDKTMTPGDFVLVFTLNLRIIENFWNIAKDMLEFWEKLGNVIQGLSVIQSPVEIKDAPHAKELLITHGEIVFDNVQFHYKDAEPIFENKSVTIKPGQKVGLVGYSGSGKSTFVSLILRLFDVTSGAILIDDYDIRMITQDSLHRAIGMIPQEPSLFHRSLMENIRYGRMDASDEEVIAAAKRAYAHEFIIEQSQGYDTLVGERGVKLSGGQRQRIAIARAMLKNAPILILDEATSQLDTVTERQIQESLWELMQDKTTIVIAHRLSTLLHMDRILVFDEGTIVGDGTHQELLDSTGLYQTLWQAQVGGLLLDAREGES